MRSDEPELSPGVIHFTFTCKSDPDTHSQQTRPKMSTSDGTKNLRNSVAQCMEYNNVILPQSSDGNSLPYSPENHRALIVVRCAAQNRPYNMVADPEYADKVQML